MKFALVCGKRTEATKGAKGICPGCGSELFARCGTIKVKHWSHKGNSNCDHWWEPETEWHRLWKNNFTSEWQEIVLHDERTQEKHIADVRTSHGLVIEFQHSYIDSEERSKRECFYKSMVWVVDGTRLKKDFTRFIKGTSSFRNANKPGFFIVDSLDETFPANWIGSSVPVIFDFRGTESINDLKELRNGLYCLLPNHNKSESKLVILSRESFINKTINGEWFRKEQEQQKQSAKPPMQPKILKRESTHYYDPRKNRMVKKWRF
jgi:hypothetical protein